MKSISKKVVTLLLAVVIVVSSLTVSEKVNAAGTYVITFNANGGHYKNNAVVKNVTMPTGVGLKLASVYDPEKRTGYTFTGWSTSKTATNPTYKNGDVLPKKKATYYAVWKKAYYTINLDANGGTFSSGTVTKKTYSIQDGNYLTVTKSYNPDAREGYEFLGWNTSKTATTVKYAVGSKLPSTNNATYYAVWTKESGRISVSLAGNDDVATNWSWVSTDVTVSTDQTSFKYYLGTNSNVTSNTSYTPSVSSTKTTIPLKFSSKGTYYFAAETNNGKLSNVVKINIGTIPVYISKTALYTEKLINLDAEKYNETHMTEAMNSLLDELNGKKMSLKSQGYAVGDMTNYSASGYALDYFYEQIVKEINIVDKDIETKNDNPYITQIKAINSPLYVVWQDTNYDISKITFSFFNFSCAGTELIYNSGYHKFVDNGGHCYGISVISALLNYRTSGFWKNMYGMNAYELSSSLSLENNSTLRKNIEIAQNYQVSGFSPRNASGIDEMISELKKINQTGKPAMISMGIYEDGGSHATLAYRYTEEKTSDGQKIGKAYIYDSNFAKQVKYVTFYLDENGKSKGTWKYFTTGYNAVGYIDQNTTTWFGNGLNIKLRTFEMYYKGFIDAYNEIKDVNIKDDIY